MSSEIMTYRDNTWSSVCLKNLECNNPRVENAHTYDTEKKRKRSHKYAFTVFSDYSQSKIVSLGIPR